MVRSSSADSPKESERHYGRAPFFVNKPVRSPSAMGGRRYRAEAS
jgi:hypothetical protein